MKVEPSALQVPENVRMPLPGERVGTPAETVLFLQRICRLLSVFECNNRILSSGISPGRLAY